MGAGRTIVQQGSALPFIMFAIGLYLLLTIPNTSELSLHEGIIDKYNIKADKPIIEIYIKGETEPYTIREKNNRKLISEALDKNKEQHITIWTDSIKRKFN